MAKYERKFIVINRKDFKYLSNQQIYYIGSVLNTIYHSRMDEGKKDNRYYVVNDDEPYADKIRKIIMEGETEKEKGGKQDV